MSKNQRKYFLYTQKWKIYRSSIAPYGAFFNPIFMWLLDKSLEEIKSLFEHCEEVEASSKAEAVVKKIISFYPNPISLPELMKLRVNGSKLASVSTHISD